MRSRRHATWAYTLTLLCVLAPALSFARSLGAAAEAEERRRAARKGAGVMVPDAPPSKASDEGGGAGGERAVAIPELARWKAQMVSYGRKGCLLFADTSLTEDQRLGGTYYDATRVYEQIADYTGDAAWDDCANDAKAIYRSYVLRNNGGVPGYWNFTSGFRMDWERKSDASSKQAAILLSERAAFCGDQTPLSWTAPPHVSREVAYCILSYVDAEALGAPRRARMRTLADQALGHIDQWFVSRTSRAPDPFTLVPPAAGQYYVQPFMVGLTMQALIRYWDLTQDPRVRPAIKTALDWLWARAWVASDKAFWYENWAADGQQAFPQRPGAPDLNLLIAPAFAWMYQQTGDVTYRDRGDQVFAGGVTRAWLVGGKQFNQNYMWSFDYVKWRSQ